jgi:hypothetical protein
VGRVVGIGRGKLVIGSKTVFQFFSKFNSFIALCLLSNSLMSTFEIKNENGDSTLPGTATTDFTFQFLKDSLEVMEKSAESREQLTQYNLIAEQANNLSFITYRFHGHFNANLLSDYELLLKEFFSSREVQQRLGLVGDLVPPVQIQYQSLSLSALTLDLFNRFFESNILSPEGRIRGCFDETFDGITVGDLLREFFVNPDSENACLFKESEKKEFLFKLLQTFVVGGSLCQPETHIDR